MVISSCTAPYYFLSKKTIGFLIIILLQLFSQVARAQDSTLFLTSTHIFWSPALELKPQDYQGEPDEYIQERMFRYGFTASASVVIWSVLDVPKKSHSRKLSAKAYFIPVFEKTTSFITDQNIQQIAIQNLYLDICEICVRHARRELKTIQDSLQSSDATSILYATVNKKMQHMKADWFRLYFEDVFIKKKEKAFETWQQNVKTALEESKEWSTTAKDFQRFSLGKPIEKHYRQAENHVGILYEQELK